VRPGQPGRGIHTRLIINSTSGRLGNSELDVKDRAAHICPVGAIVVKETAFQVPIGQRKYDHRTIAEVSLEGEAPLVRRRDDAKEEG